MRDFPPLYSAILRALAEALAANLPSRGATSQDDQQKLSATPDTGLGGHERN